MARKSATSFEGPANGHATTPSSLKDEKPTMTSPLQETTTNSSAADVDDEEKPIPFDPSLLPNGSRDLSFIGLQAFFLGITLATSILLTLYFLSITSAWWRLSSFVTCLSIFHFLEYYTTARYNAPSTRASSFLLFNNGSAYAAAHTLATLEIILSIIFPKYHAAGLYRPLTLTAGVTFILLGQTVRSIAMKQAGTNFNHIVATEHRQNHILVTRGMYAYLRHPSYFGFFWWAIGTQLLVGNKVCLVGYAVVLWNFFYTRTIVEERNLVKFFGQQYEEYRKRTGTLIPFVP
ncbi:related to prenyl cysteine carboxyl methyltransferase Ste14 [Ramularia collo-cygni]|uniref:Protein-S-isoprenylcysteine O-methyltransferase n=1 Tax=Ramularia collo-cygni TaxID=112498 RepID=A0A2D3VKA2_9PEZI|nr:related to prenyl cysteine carboxyl methyltransferase Ste14 [Ramularia collo-cygni]CZT24921.1 related to prenyl cysteine carboxyl methyltransferase Ste14 [Ramularia collo-cygni]